MELKDIWQSRYRGDIHEKMWDSAAEDYLGEHLEELAENGMVRETITTTIVTIDWKIQ